MPKENVNIANAGNNGDICDDNNDNEKKYIDINSPQSYVNAQFWGIMG